MIFFQLLVQISYCSSTLLYQRAREGEGLIHTWYYVERHLPGPSSVTEKILVKFILLISIFIYFV